MDNQSTVTVTDRASLRWHPLTFDFGVAKRRLGWRALILRSFHCLSWSWFGFDSLCFGNGRGLTEAILGTLFPPKKKVRQVLVLETSWFDHDQNQNVTFRFLQDTSSLLSSDMTQSCSSRLSKRTSPRRTASASSGHGHLRPLHQ